MQDTAQADRRRAPNTTLALLLFSTRPAAKIVQIMVEARTATKIGQFARSNLTQSHQIGVVPLGLAEPLTRRTLGIVSNPTSIVSICINLHNMN